MNTDPENGYQSSEGSLPLSSGEHHHKLRRSKAKHAPRYEGVVKIVSEAIFFTVAALLVAGPLVLGSIRPWGTVTIGIISSVLAVLIGVKILVQPEKSFRVGILDAFVAGFLLYLFVWYLNSPIELSSRLVLIRAIVYALVFYAVTRHMPSNKHAHALAMVVVAVGVFEGIYGVLMWLQESPYIILDILRAPQYAGRAGGTYNNPNHYAGYLEMALPVALAYGLASKWPTPVRWVLLALAGCMAWGIIVSFSRGGWMVVAGAIFVFALLLLRYSRVPKFIPFTVIGLVLLAGFAAVLALPMMMGRFESVMNDAEGCRFYFYGDALKIIEAHPWFGTGPGTFEFVHPAYQHPGVLQRAIYTHCDYLNTLADYGLLGGLLVNGFLVFAVTLLFVVRNSLKGRNDTAIWIGCSTALVALLLHSAVDFNMNIPGNALTLFALVALPFALRREMPWTVDVGRVPAFLFALVLPILAVWLGTTATCTGLAQDRVAKAHKVGEQGAFAAMEVMVKDVLTLDPKNDHAYRLLGDAARVKSYAATDLQAKLALGVDALGHYQKATKLNPLDPNNVLKQAAVYREMGRLDESFMLLKKAQRLAPYNRDVFRKLGEHYHSMGMWVEAKENYSKAAAYGEVISPRLLDEVIKLEQQQAQQTQQQVAP